MAVQPRHGQQRRNNKDCGMEDIGALVPGAPRKRPRRGDKGEVASFASLAALENWTTDADSDLVFLESQASQTPRASCVEADGREEDEEAVRADGTESQALVIFRVPHKHPHMLKRPLQHVDAMSALDMAVRVYSVVRSDGPDAFCVQRAEGADIFLTELLTSDAADSKLIKKLKQYKVQDQIDLDTGRMQASLEVVALNFERSTTAQPLKLKARGSGSG